MKYNFLKSKFIIIFVLFFLGAGIVLIHQFIPHWQWKAIPFHSLIEGLGGLVALFLAGLFAFLLKSKKIPNYYLPVSLAFVAMGIFDLFHASVLPGSTFVWLHSSAIFFGGFISVFVWLPERICPPRYLKPLMITVLFCAIIMASLMVSSPQLFPSALKDGIFTSPVIYLNIVGGLLLLVAAGRLFIYSMSDVYQHNFLFVIFFLLNGLSGIIFKFSEVWSPEWWFWHMIRLGAFFVAGLYIFIIYQKEETAAELSEERKKASEAIAEISLKKDKKIEELEKRIKELGN